MVLPKFLKSSPDKKKKHKSHSSADSRLNDDIYNRVSPFPPTPPPSAPPAPLSREDSVSSPQRLNRPDRRRNSHPPPEELGPHFQQHTTAHTPSHPHTRQNSRSSAASTPRTSPRKAPTEPPSRSSRREAQPARCRSSTPPLNQTVFKNLKPSSKKSVRRSHRSRDNIHPLNLPPDELRRLAQATMSDDNGTYGSMDVDSGSPAAPFSSSSASAHQSSPTTPAPETNGVLPEQPERLPTPPPHMSMPQPVDPEAHKLAGNKFFKAGDYVRAIQEYTKAVEAQPTSATYLSNRAAAYMSANRYLQALEDAKQADALEPGNPKIMHRLARIYTALGRPAEALNVYDRIDPPASAKDRAPAAAMLHNVKQAEETLRDDKGGSMALYCLDQATRGLGAGVTQPRKWLLLRIEAYLKMGNVNALGDAQNIAMSLLRENNQDPDALFLRGRLFYLQGDNDQAINHFRRVLSLDPDATHAVKYLRMVQKLLRTKDEGNAAFKARKYREAIEIYTRGLEIDPSNRDINSKLLQNRAQAYSNLKEYEKAIEDCTKALEFDPTYIKARRTRAKAYGGAGNWDEAVRELKNIAENHPEEKGIREEIRNAEWELKKSKRKDYYKILGVDKDATEQEIKKAYRKKAIQHHPDKNVNGDKSDEAFKEIVEAYETLSDPQKRASYDNGDDLLDPSNLFGGGGFGGMGGMGGFGMGGMGGMGGQNIRIDPNIFFNMMNQGGFAGGGGGNPFASRGW
ncbi:hypothetical protein VTO42DRAFT_19 [Malbranchea cinnamomea]